MTVIPFLPHSDANVAVDEATYYVTSSESYTLKLTVQSAASPAWGPPVQSNSLFADCVPFDAEALLTEVRAVFAESSAANWDEEGALPVTIGTRDLAIDAIALFPLNAPTPEVAASRKGWIVFEWHPSRDAIFSILVHEGQDVAISRRFFGRSVYGTTRLDQEVTGEIEQHLRRIFIPAVAA